MKCPLCDTPMRRIEIKRIEGYVHKPSDCALYRAMAWETPDLEYFRSKLSAAHAAGFAEAREAALVHIESHDENMSEVIASIRALQPKEER